MCPSCVPLFPQLSILPPFSLPFSPFSSPSNSSEELLGSTLFILRILSIDILNGMSTSTDGTSSSRTSFTSSVPPPSAPSSRVFAQLMASGLSVGTATACTNPIDVVKVRMQISTPPGTLASTASAILREDGPLGLFRGWQPAVGRAFSYGALRLGLYQPIKKWSEAHFTHMDPALIKIASGATCGALAGFLSNPVDLVKVRMQLGDRSRSSTSTSTSSTSKRSLSSSPLSVVKEVVQKDGVTGLWRGSVAGMSRAAVLTATQLATYDETKQWIKRRTGWGEHIGTFLTAAMATGLVSTTITSPVDVIKTFMYQDPGRVVPTASTTETPPKTIRTTTTETTTRLSTTSTIRSAASHGHGVGTAIRAVWHQGGSRAFFRGWTANWARLGPQTAITFVVYEWVRDLMGLGAF